MTQSEQRDQRYATVALQMYTKHTEQSPAKIMINTSCQKQKKSNNLVNATGNDVSKVRIENEKRMTTMLVAMR